MYGEARGNRTRGERASAAAFPGGVRGVASRMSERVVRREIEAKPLPADVAGSVEAILLTSDRPIPPRRMAEVLGLADEGPIDDAVRTLNETYAATGRSFRLERVAGGFRVMTLPEFGGVLSAFHKSRSEGRLSRASLESLAIIAYKQPITRAHLEAIRGVGCGEVLRSLLERRLVTVKGRAEELGRPLLYGTTKEFLDHFGLSTVADLPTIAELKGAP